MTDAEQKLYDAAMLIAHQLAIGCTITGDSREGRAIIAAAAAAADDAGHTSLQNAASAACTPPAQVEEPAP